MPTPLQEQLLRAGLAKKAKLHEVAREKVKQKHAKQQGHLTSQTDAVDADKLLAERAERDRAIAAERNAQAHAKERYAQIAQIIESHRVPAEGEVSYRFVDDGKVLSILVTEVLKKQLAKGSATIARHGSGYAILLRDAANKVLERGGTLVVDHRNTAVNTSSEDIDPHYAQFVVPDDLQW